MEPLVLAQLQAGSTYCLIDRRWYTEWLQWVGHPSVQSPSMGPKADPYRIGSPGMSYDEGAGAGTPMSAAKRTRTQSWTKDRPGPIDNKELLEGGSSTAIKKELSERSDFEIVPKEAWDLLHQWYGGGPCIKRRAVQLPSGGVQVELHGLRLQVFTTSDMGNPLEINESKYTIVREFKATLCKELTLDAEKVRVWDYFDHVLPSRRVGSSRNDALLDLTPEKTLASCRIIDQPVLLEEQNHDGTWPYKESETTTSYGASSSSSYRLGNSTSFSTDMPTIGQPLQRGVVGLQNLGNTCFMNSSLQCLSNIPAFRDFFLSEDYKAQLNRQAYKTQGKLAESFAELLATMWREDTTRVAPRNFKWQVGQFAEQFSGFGQQDSMELIEYVLSGLQEDCNRVQGPKPYVEVKEADGRDDDEAAAEALEAYQRRQDSRVDELFVGLFKSVVRCPEPAERCGRCSVTFDVALSAKLALASQAEERTAHFCLTAVLDGARAAGEEHSRQIRVTVGKDQPVKALIEAAVDQVEGLAAESCILVEIWNKKVHKFFEEKENLETIRTEDVLVLYEVGDAKAFQVSTEQRWGGGVSTGYSLNGVPEEAEASVDPTSPRAESCGIIAYHRRASVGYGYSSSYYSSASKEIYGMPMLLSAPKDCSGKRLCAEVARKIQELAPEPAADGEAGPPSWRVYKVDKWSPTSEGTLIDPESDEPLELSDSREYCAVEWEEGAAPKALLVQEAVRAGERKAEPAQQDIRGLLKLFTTEEKLDPDNAWYCNKCKEHKEAWKKMEFHTTPKVLVLQLKRFSYTRWSRERLNTPVDFPLEGLDLTPYCTPAAQETAVPETMLYDLAAYSKHIGSQGGGHYVAYARSSMDGDWYHFDDATVRRATADEVEADKVGAYVLFYVRRDCRPVTFGPQQPQS